MSSDSTTLLDPPAPRRPYKVIVFMDKDTLRVVERQRGPAGRRRSKSEAAYLLMLAGIEAERAAVEVPSAAQVEEDRRRAERRAS
jgi:hypothetical protein